MVSNEYLEDSQYESMAPFDASMNTVVPDSIGFVEEVVDDVDLIVEDSGDETEPTTEAIVDFRSPKTTRRSRVAKVIHDFDLNEPSVEEIMEAAKYKGERDFDLNKLPIAGMFRLSDPTCEPEFIEMLRLLLPSFY